MKRIALIIGLGTLCLVMGGCAKVALRPYSELPKPLVVPTPAKVGVVITPETANYTHKESRASVEYEAQLGESHRELVEQIFAAASRMAAYAASESSSVPLPIWGAGPLPYPVSVSVSTGSPFGA